MAKGMLSGYLSAKNSKALSPAVKAKILEAPDGMVRKFRVVGFFDANGEPVVLQGKVRVSKEGGLTCQVGLPVEIESFLAPSAGEKAPETDEGKAKLADSLLG